MEQPLGEVQEVFDTNVMGVLRVTQVRCGAIGCGGVWWSAVRWGVEGCGGV